MKRGLPLLAIAALAVLLAARPAAAQDRPGRPGLDAEKIREILDGVAAGATRNAGPDLTGVPSGEASDREALRRIAPALERRATVSFRDTPLLEAIDFFTDVSALNVVLSPAAREQAEARKTSLRLREVSLRNVLTLLLDGTELAFGVRHGVLWIGLRSEFPRPPRLVIYDVSDLVHEPPDSVVPKLGLPGDSRK